MKIVVFGPFKRTGARHGESVVDLSRAYAKYLQERTVEPNPLEMADVVVPSDLVRLIEGGPRALEAAQQALDYLFGEAQNNLGPRGERLVHRAADVRLHAPRPNNARIACAGGNFADHAAAMAVRMRGKPYEGDAYQEIRNAGFWGFWKLGREIVGPDGELIYPERCNRLDYEGEIAIVLGKRGADLKVSQLKDYVWGVTMLADWSIRAPRETPGGPLNFNFPKNFDTSCSMDPCIRRARQIQPTSTWRRSSTASAGSGLTRAIWCSHSVNISNICRAISRSIRVTSSAVGRRQERRRIRVNYCRTRPLHRSAS
jgi:2-keto-4-pentenoate hydratase/2-oxohepta-3-ene-1,7-dioic acid hydratase in catechol pathway